MGVKYAKWFVAASWISLVLLAGVQIYLAKEDSQTTDEAVHLSAGYTYLTRGDWRFNPEHPPLAKEMAALPLLLLKPKLNAKAEALWDNSTNYFYDSWQENRKFGEMFLYDSGNNPDQLLFWARLPMVLITVALGATIFLIAWRHWGALAGFVATALYSFNPTVNGHGHLITTDISLALGFLLTIYFFWQLINRPKVRTAIYFGLSLGLALLFKHTAILIFPVLAAVALYVWITSSKRPKLSRFAGLCFCGLAIAWAMIWAGYGFRGVGLPATDSVSQAIREALIASKTPDTDITINSKADFAYSIARPVLSLFPREYVKGLLMVVAHASNGHQSFLLGKASNSGWWYYFPVVFFLKTPLPALLAIGLAGFFFLKSKLAPSLAGALAIAGAVFFLLAMLSRANLGIRHILPAFTPSFLLAGWAASQNRRMEKIALLLVSWSAIVYIFAAPYFLSYYNELVGGSRQGYKIATDSNTDWGQDLKRIARSLEKSSPYPLYVEYGWDGFQALDYYLGKENYRLLSQRQPNQPGWAIIGASALNEPTYQYLKFCPTEGSITPSVLICQLKTNGE